MAISKVIYGSTVLLDISTDTVDATHLASGVTAHKSDGTAITGTATYTYDATDESMTVPSWAVEME